MPPLRAPFWQPKMDISATGAPSDTAYSRLVSPRVRAIADAFNAVEVQANAVDDLDGERWRKLMWNVPFNGLSIGAGANVAEVLADAALRGGACADG